MAPSKPISIVVLLLLVGLSLLSSCTHRSLLSPQMKPALQSERCAYWHTFQANLKLKTTNISSREGSYLIYCFSYKSNVRINITSLWGETIAVITTNDEETSLWMPSRKTLYKSADTEKFLEQLTGYKASIRDILSLITGCFEEGKKNISFSGKDNKLFSVKIPSEDGDLLVYYDPPLDMTSSLFYPRHLTLRGPNYTFSIEVVRIEKVDKIPEDLFNVTYPENTSVIYL